MTYRCDFKCRFIVAFAGLLLLVSLFFPIWSYYITAPQYPEGLYLHIFANKLTGDLNNINTLNHYVGMKDIHPDSFPELKIMPLIIVSLSALAVLSVIVGRKILVYLWFIIFAILGIVGLADFYRWLYHYGHDLDPNAPLKLGMDYTPPIIGIRKMLNITVHAYPNIGGIAILLSALLGLIGIVLSLRGKK